MRQSMAHDSLQNEAFGRSLAKFVDLFAFSKQFASSNTGQAAST
jgi:hypothetical protein